MEEMNCVEVIVEKKKYAVDGVHKGMQGWICDPRNITGSWLVNFPQYGEKDDIATIAVDEEDLKLLPNGMDAMINDRLKEYYDGLDQKAASTKMQGDESISDYLI